MNSTGGFNNVARWGIALMLSALAAGCGGDGHRDPILGTDGNVVSPPTASTPVPSNGATGVSVSTTGVNATFSEAMSAFSGGSTFAVTCAAPCVNPPGAVTLNSTGRIATYTFSAGTTLLPLTLYTATVTDARSATTGLAMTSPFAWSFTTGAIPDTTRPQVALTVPSSTTPGPTLGAATNASIVATFDESMAPASIGLASFTVTCSAPCVSPTGTVSYVSASKAAVYTPASSLELATTYTATITTAATDVAGNGLAGNQAALPAASNYVWTFTTSATADTTRPSVTVTIPATTSPGPTSNTAPNTAITATFSEDILPSTLTATSFTVTCAAPCASPTGSISYDIASKSAVFTPTAPLTFNSTYTATLTTALTDLSDNTLAGNQAPPPAASNYVWTFSTGVASDAIAPTVTLTNPAANAVGVCVNKTIGITFSEPMNPLTITTATVRLAVTAGASVTGVVAYDSQTNIATFNPATDLTGTPPTSYTVTVAGGPNGVKDIAGNPLAVDSSTSFTTNASSCATAPELGAAARFGSFGGNATLTNDGLNTIINGDVGVNASSTTVTGLRDTGGNVYTITTDNNGLVNGLIYTLTAPPGSVAGLAANQARVDALLAFNSISPAALPGGIDVSSLAQCPSCGGAGGGPDELAGRVLPPGVYMSTSGTYDIGGVGRTTANLTLDGGGDTSAVWIFQTSAGTGTLNVGLTGPATPAVPIQILLINGAQAANVFWYVPAGANIGTGSTMVGTLLADASITLSTTGGSPPTAVLTTLNGRAIALTAGVTMTNTIVNVPAP
jgi:hypothetical protein